MRIEMGEFVKILLSLSFSGTFLFLIVFLVVQMYRNRLSRRWQYYIWLLVVFRFLIPFTFPHTVTGYLFRGVEQAVADAAKNAEQEAVLESAADMPDDVPKNAAGGEDVAAGIADDPQEKVDGQGAASGTGTASDVVTVSFQRGNGDRRMSVFSLCVFRPRNAESAGGSGRTAGDTKSDRTVSESVDRFSDHDRLSPAENRHTGQKDDGWGTVLHFCA